MPKTLLLADDSVVIQKLVGLSLANQDIELITADNGDDAIALATTHRPDAVIADVVMPGRSGYEVCEAIGQDPTLAHIPVLLLTGTFEAFDEQRAQDVGAVGHITKPFEAQALVECVADLFSATRAGLPGTDHTLTVAPDAPGELVGDFAASPLRMEPEGPTPGQSDDLFEVQTQDDSDWLAPPAELGVFADPTFDDAAPGSDTTLLASDLFDEAPRAAAPLSPILDAEPDAPQSDPLWMEPAAADFDLSASEFAAPSASREPAEVVASPAAQSLGASHGLETVPPAAAPELSTAARESLHETLEKVAWEAFSDLSEQVVRQVLERVETIAWEVIPQLTETLVREEIRRLKGEDEQ